MKQEYALAIPFLQKAVSLTKNPHPLKHLGFAYGKTNQKEKALEILERVKTTQKNHYYSSFFLAEIYIGLGDLDTAFKELNKAYASNDANMRFLWLNPVFHSQEIQHDPRYRDLLNKMGLGHLSPRTAKHIKN